MGIIPGGLPTNAESHSYHSAKRKNMQRAKCPEELIVKLPKWHHQEDTVSFLVNTNPHVSGKDTLKPYRDDQHPQGYFHSLDEALEVARQVFARQEELRNAHTKALAGTLLDRTQKDTWELSGNLGG